MFHSGSRIPMVRWLEDFAGALSSVVFPAGCRLCDAPLFHARRLPLCETCLASFQMILPPICSVCGQVMPVAPQSSEAAALCRDCTLGKYSFQAARSFGFYEGALAHAIILLKYERLEPLGSYFAMQLLQLVRADAHLLPADVVVPVPLHRQKHKERGFNHNTVHLRMWIAELDWTVVVGRRFLGRRGKLLILRFTPRGLQRLRLETTRSCRISSSTNS